MMFSSRFTWSLHANRLSRVLEARHAAGQDVLDLTESNPTRAGFDYSAETILAALAQPQALVYEPSPRGLSPARAAIAGYYASLGHAVDPEALHLTASTSEAYAFLFKLLADPGDEVLAPQPSYPLFDFLTALEAVKLLHYPLHHDRQAGWRIDLERLAAMISTKTRALLVVNPNNPTGSFLKQEERQALNALCREYDLALISDEVFADYGHGDDPQRVTTLIDNHAVLTFVLGGLSKTLGLPQMKLAWIHVAGPADLAVEARERLDFIADTYLSVGTPVQQATPRLLALRREIQQQIRQRVAANERHLREQCHGRHGVRLLPREGGWYAVLALPPSVREEEFTLALLAQDHVLVHPGYFFDFAQEGFLVVSLLTRPAVLQEGTTRLLARLARGWDLRW
ncbi:MAG: pyridoxal phosphate-dependent aminotransferase [candidate division KSB1 bacterium]|nr:pyridoxal phosphate-dependent aminotransferase [candidate division KSB1 bacterium]MDZ7273344.1 pyridoxal phosphate-dependent aminotransferase [candidate division KSB1 bacterium]MDZ7288006.1 pyridoxal phosphate-dependent aminotransferase [candidate division KSB1 bacterium]MDZ7300142.1 pyridoxal phosphate-dependent aminotransferase [candidate division KSB1 bacterium]MDZ7308470.1 pyridoxal phosphate-dependent aminotransferase [candidate division KSB1 bacterium]